MTLFLARPDLTTELKVGHRATTLLKAVVPRPESCPATAMACLPGSSCLSAAMLSRRGSIASALDRQFQRSATRPASTWPCSPYQMPPAQQPFFRPGRSLDGEPWPSGGGHLPCPYGVRLRHSATLPQLLPGPARQSRDRWHHSRHCPPPSLLAQCLLALPPIIFRSVTICFGPLTSI